MRGLLTLKVRSTPTPLAMRRTVIERWMPPAAQAHDGALEDLDALAGAFDDAGGDADGVARAEFRKIGPDLVLGDLFEHVHDRSLLFVKRRGCARWLMMARSPAAMKAHWNRPPARPTAKDSTTAAASLRV